MTFRRALQPLERHEVRSRAKEVKPYLDALKERTTTITNDDVRDALKAVGYTDVGTERELRGIRNAYEELNAR